MRRSLRDPKLGAIAAFDRQPDRQMTIYGANMASRSKKINKNCHEGKYITSATSIPCKPASPEQ